MPPVNKHLLTSKERTGKEYRKIHEWLDGSDPATKALCHDITKIYEFARSLRKSMDKRVCRNISSTSMTM